MTVSKRAWLTLGASFLVAVAFQNCGKGMSSSNTTTASIGTTVSSVSEPDTTDVLPPASSPQPGPTGTAPIDQTTCMKEYFTAFPWLNHEVVKDDLTVQFTPQLGQTKIKTFKFHGASSPINPRATKWFFGAYFPLVNGNPKNTMWIEKDGNDYSRLDCFFQSGAPPYGNIGVRPMNGFMGFIGNDAEYIACRIHTADAGEKVRIQSADGTFIDIGKEQAFVLKRGCFQ